MSFGERLRQWREDAGLTHDGLAQVLGVTQSAVSEWEVDPSRLPDVRRARDLAVVFGLPEGTVVRAIKAAHQERADKLPPPSPAAVRVVAERLAALEDAVAQQRSHLDLLEASLQSLSSSADQDVDGQRRPRRR